MLFWQSRGHARLAQARRRPSIRPPVSLPITALILCAVVIALHPARPAPAFSLRWESEPDGVHRLGVRSARLRRRVTHERRIRSGPLRSAGAIRASFASWPARGLPSPPLPSAAGPLIELCFENRPRVWVRHGVWFALDIALGGGHISDERNERDQRQAAHGPVAEPQAGDRVRL
jgi:hypothetical protein